MAFTLFLVLLSLIPTFIWLIPSNNITASQLWGSFIGVIAALIIFLIQKTIDQYFDKRRKNRLAIIKTHIECVKLIHAMSWNIKELNNLLNTLKPLPPGTPKELTSYLIQPREMIIDITIIEGIKKLQFVQDFLDLYFRMQDLNSIMKTTFEWKKRFEEDWKNRSIPNQEIEIYRTRLSEEIAEFQKQLEIIKELWAKSKILAEKGFWTKLFERPSYSKKQKKAFLLELKNFDEGSMPEYEKEKT